MCFGRREIVSVQPWPGGAAQRPRQQAAQHVGLCGEGGPGAHAWRAARAGHRQVAGFPGGEALAIAIAPVQLGAHTLNFWWNFGAV